MKRYVYLRRKRDKKYTMRVLIVIFYECMEYFYGTIMDEIIYSNDFRNVILFTGFYLLVPTLPLFIKEIGGNESQVGLMMGMFTIAAVVIRPIIGGMLDRYGRRSFIIFGLIFLA